MAPSAGDVNSRCTRGASRATATAVPAVSTQPSFDALARAARAAAIGDAFPAFAHEANNALLAILGLAELALKELPPGTKAHERLTLLHGTALELSRGVRVLHGFTRTPDGDGLVELDAVVREAVGVAERTTASQRLEYATSFAGAGFRVAGSARLLGQVVLALLAEARRTLVAGGTVDVSLARDGGRVVLTVSPSGPELDPDAPGEDELGLWVAQQAAALHDGALSAAAATLTLTLPTAEAE